MDGQQQSASLLKASGTCAAKRCEVASAWRASDTFCDVDRAFSSSLLHCRRPDRIAFHPATARHDDIDDSVMSHVA